ncbi:TetR/AcrR family transcriptional regulator [Marinicella sp. W31]|uniref:TetR/AcrR family transcriptional regulator n=1 Tax=Marinicella sp. W31 TaxID=3023713 RepID=UPI003757D297
MSLGRPRKFEPEEILELVMDVFWSKGYEATSLADLMAATGLHKGSLYQAFGDKKSLFMSALQAYLDNIYQMQFDIIKKNADPAEGLREALYCMLDYNYQGDEDSSNKGCMAVNTLVETAPHDPEISQLLEKQHAKFDRLFINTIQKAIDLHAVGNGLPAETINGLLFLTMCGLSANTKNLMAQEQAKFLLDQQLELLCLK